MSRWPMRPLEEIAEVYGGGTPDRENPSYWGGDILWVTPTDLPTPDEGISVVTKTKDQITADGLRSSSATLVPESSVLFSSRATIGKVAVAGKPLSTNQGFVLFVPRPGVNPRYLAYALWRSRERISQLSGSTTFKEVTRGNLRKFAVPVPTLAEQERIVKLLDEADALRKLRAEADRRTAELIPALFYEMFGDPVRDAPRLPLGEVAEVVSGVAKGRRFKVRTPIEVPYLRVANVQAGYLDLSEIKTIEALPEEVDRLSLRAGDVLLTEGGDFDKLGRGALLDHDLPDHIHQNHVFRVRVNSDMVLPIYFASYLQTSDARDFFLSCAKRTTNLASINMGQLRALLVPLPPFHLQKAFCNFVNRLGDMTGRQSCANARVDSSFNSFLRYHMGNG